VGADIRHLCNEFAANDARFGTQALQNAQD
jgi:hypothetical protein